MMVGGISEAKPATPDIQELADLVSNVPTEKKMHIRMSRDNIKFKLNWFLEDYSFF